jgi:nitroreductase
MLTKVWSDSDKRLIPVVVGGTVPPPFLRNWVWLTIDPDREPANWTRRVVVAALRSAREDTRHVPSQEDRRERRQRLDEISRSAQELGKHEPEHGDLLPG